MGVLRTLLAIAVVEFHSVQAAGNAPLAPMGMPNGIIAVQAFYVISGFYMSLVLVHKYRGRALGFYAARLWRLMPTYWLVLALTIATLGVPPASGAVAIAWTAFANLTLIGAEWPFSRMLVSPAWTLGVELEFYAIVPVLALWRWWWLAALMAGSIAARLVGTHYYGLGGEFWLYRFFPFELAWFLAGMLAHRAYRVGAQVNLPVMRALGVPALLLMLASILVYPVVWYSSPWLLPHAVLHGDGQVVKFIMPILLPFIFALTKDSRIDAFVGEFSYPVYIGHFLILTLLVTNGILGGALLLLGSITFAALLLLIFRPMEWRRERLLARA